MSQPDYGKAFQDGAVITMRVGAATRQCTLHVHPLGKLSVTSGYIVTCDPLAAPDMPPLANAVPSGQYPVFVSVAELPNGDQRVAYALLRLSDSPAVRWEMAVPQGKTLSSLEPGYIYGYPVDAGTGCFMDAETRPACEARPIQMGDGYVESDELLDTLYRLSAPTWSWANLIVDKNTGANVIAFSSGWGDGFYASYWGFDAANQMVALLTDFEVLGDSWEVGGITQLPLFEEQ